MPTVRVTPSGIMDKDTDLQYVGQGNYVDANDIRNRQTDGNTFGGIMSVAGNANLLNSTDDSGNPTTFIPGYLASIRTYRVYIDLSKIADGSVSSNDGDLFLETSAGTVFTNPDIFITGTVIAPYIATLKTFINSLFNSAYGGLPTYSATTTTGTYTAYFEITSALDTGFILRVNNITATLCEFKLVTEYIASGGNFKVIGSQQLDEYLFVWCASGVVSEIGVIYSTNKDASFTYIRLIRSTKLNFQTDRRIEAEIERNGNEVNLYWTDGYNKPRTMYLKFSNITIQDGFLVNSGGSYDLDTVNDESSLILNPPDAYLTDIKVNNSGGVISSGNKRYTGRFLTEDFVSTDFLYPTNPINIYAASSLANSKIQGDESQVITDKSVTMTIKNFKPGIYSFFELIVLEYVGITFTAKIVQRFALPPGVTEFNLQHGQTGQDNIPLSNQELLAITSKYLTAANLKVFDNRIVMSNLTEQVDYNLNAWSQSIKHSISETYIQGTSLAQNPNNSEPGLKYGEYQDPENVLNRVGYMYNDTYRFGIQVRWKNTSKWSLPYWVDDIRIDNASSNVIGSRRQVFGGSVTAVDVLNDRLTVLNHNFDEGQAIIFSASTIGGVAVNVIYYAINVTKDTFQITTTFGGTTAENITSGGTGTVADKKVDTNLTDGLDKTKVYYVKFHNINLNFLVDGIPLRNLISSFRIVRAERIKEVISTGYYFIGQTALHPLGYYTPDGMNNAGLKVGGGANTQHLFYYSPDYYFGKSYENLKIDKVKILAPPIRSAMTVVSGYANGNPATASGIFSDFTGYFVDPTVTALNYQTFDIQEHTRLELGDTGQVGASNIALSAEISSTKTLNYRASEVFKITTPIPNFAAPITNNQVGFYYGQIFRDLGANKKYPINKEQTLYQGVGNQYILSTGENGTISNISVFGGDVFIQKSYMLLRMSNNASPMFGTTGSAFGFYSQNVSNLQMINVPDNDGTFTGPGYQFPQKLDSSFGGTHPAGSWGSGVLYWVEQWPEVSNQQNYTADYDILDGSILENGYNENITYDGFLPSRIAWSAKKVIGSQKDNYRIFKPLDFADLDLTFGPISHHEVLNNSFYTFQPYSVQRQYFRDASLLGAQEGTDVVVGSGSILGAPGQQISSIGLFKKWSHVKGKNPTGKDTFYWYNDQVQKILRFGDDGTRVISDKGMLSYLVNNGRYVSGENYPLSGKGVHGVWNDKYAEAIFTFKYTIAGETEYKFTLVYDEIKNGFVCFHSYWPDIYLKYKNIFWSPNVADPKYLFLHDKGAESTYYGTFVAPTLTAVMNYEPNASKNFEALQMVTDKNPYRMDFTTSNHISFLTNTDFEQREDLWYSPIKNDSTGTGVNSNDTSRLWGKWLKMKFSFQTVSGKQKLINFMVKFRLMARLYNQ
jgi:hypothetical protein